MNSRLSREPGEMPSTRCQCPCECFEELSKLGTYEYVMPDGERLRVCGPCKDGLTMDYQWTPYKLDEVRWDS